jgi:DNA-binding NtrC family response regulator
MSKANILVVDDQDSIRHFVSRTLEDAGYTVVTVGSVREARAAIEHDMPDLAILDLKLPDGTGLELLREIKRTQPEVSVILMTAFGELETAVEAMSAGAFWFVKKPFQNQELLALAERALDSQKMWIELRRLRNQAFADEDYLHSTSPRMQEAYAIAEQVARGDTTSVLIEGESGTGKEYFANMIHRMSARHDKPFVEINCAAIPSELLESELFGHEKGAFTDARTQKLGLMELATGGTLFLDEIGEMAHMLQVKLLRVLERRMFRRVGGTKDITVNLRIIAATNRDLERMVGEGHFREDLYYRLKVVPLYVPPLRERREDILPLSRLFMDRFARQFKKAFRDISPAAERVLLDYPWPGNIRELRNLFERTVLLESGEILEAHHLKLASRARPAAEATLGQRVDEALHGAISAGGIPFESLVEDLERALIVRASCATKWNQSRTAELLNLKRDKLRYRMKIYGLQPEHEASDPTPKVA